MRLEVFLSPLYGQGENTKKVCGIFQRLQTKLTAQSSEKKSLCSCQGPQEHVAIPSQKKKKDISLESVSPPVAPGDVALSSKTHLQPPDTFLHKGQRTNAKGRPV